MVSDFLSECWIQLRKQIRQSAWQGRVQFSGALSGRDNTAVQKFVGGLLKLVLPDPTTPVPGDALEWVVRLALECRRRVKDQQKRIGSAEFRNTHFSYTMGEDGVEKFVSTPEFQSEDSIGEDPLPPGQVWVMSPGGMDENPGLYRVECNRHAPDPAHPVWVFVDAILRLCVCNVAPEAFPERSESPRDFVEQILEYIKRLRQPLA